MAFRDVAHARLRELTPKFGIEHDALDCAAQAVDGATRQNEFSRSCNSQCPAGLSNATTGTPQAISSSGKYDGCSDTVSATPTSHVR